MPSSLSNGRYQIGQLIGRGGMAEVHVGLDTRLGRTIAIKIMRADLANDEIFLTRFRREAHSVAQMNNANIVNIYDSGEEIVTDENGQSERLPYLVMEYVKGQTLRDIIHVNGPLSQRDAAQVMLGMLSALEYSHRMGVIHRDIKPANIMISDQGAVKVMDFGIARALDDSVATMTQSQGVVGTAQYLSPEQARGETVDMRSDLYSAGCVLYEMLTGKPPFTGDSAVAIAYQHVSEVATPPSAVVPGLPKMWDSICAKAMAKDRQNRYATATEFKQDILTFMNGGEPVAAAFNPLTDLTNMKARKQAEQDAATAAMGPNETGQTTQAFNPVTGQFHQVPASNVLSQTRAAQRAQAAKAKRRKQIIIGSVIGVIVLLCVIAGAWFLLNPSKSKTEQMVTVPTITSSMTKDRAEAAIEAAGFEFKAMTDNDSTEPAGTFTKQDPAGGVKAKKGSVVKAWFSAGPQNAQIPDVKGMSQSEARTKLEAAGFKVQTSVNSEDSATVDKDRVTRTDPAAGTSQPKGTSILMFVSSGMTKVPDGLAGQTKDAVIKSLQDLQFSIVTEETYSDSVAEGMVVSTNPASGTSVAQRSTITITVSKGKEPTPQVTVPDVTGQSFASAKQVLESLGFTVKQQGSTGENDKVISQNPAGGNADKGAIITLTTQDSASSGGSGGSGGNGGNGNGSSDNH
ncbi:MAG: Stk1 family PASTA domain-containing Ser/Thr kinase [Bifidobacterium sp.]|nr:Stk1 family PASTA domain-containing Ser/Thr kinase [Bifidobacterium merycicum]MBQ1514045.1 Stk1 family PASTA domain-containing Ser/Thr kinase [Bifidobacterium sp.]